MVQELAQEVIQPTILAAMEKDKEQYLAQTIEEESDGLRDHKVIMVAYREEVDELTSKQPTISKVTIDKTGVAKFGFSRSMLMKKEWKDKYENDKPFFNKTINLEKIEKRRLEANNGSEMAYMTFYTQDAVTGLKKEIKNVYIKDLTSRKIELQLMFDNPETISLGSQTTPDDLVFKIDEDLILNDEAGYSLVLTEGVQKKDGV